MVWIRRTWTCLFSVWFCNDLKSKGMNMLISIWFCGGLESNGMNMLIFHLVLWKSGFEWNGHVGFPFVFLVSKTMKLLISHVVVEIWFSKKIKCWYCISYCGNLYSEKTSTCWFPTCSDKHLDSDTFKMMSSQFLLLAWIRKEWKR